MLILNFSINASMLMGDALLHLFYAKKEKITRKKTIKSKLFTDNQRAPLKHRKEQKLCFILELISNL